MTPTKLTKPQESLLRELAKEAVCIDRSYEPAVVLVRCGFVREEFYASSILLITDAGREWIKERDAL
jgi:hypothetical protein